MSTYSIILAIFFAGMLITVLIYYRWFYRNEEEDDIMEKPKLPLKAIDAGDGDVEVYDAEDNYLTEENVAWLNHVADSAVKLLAKLDDEQP